MDERILLGLAVLFYAAASLRPLLRAGDRRSDAARDPLFWAFAAGFACHFAFLILRGREIRHCPISNLFEITVYVLWSAGGVYLLVGSLYRMTLLGLLTGPAMAAGLAGALMLADDKPASAYPMGAALEMHAGLSILAYGALGIAGVCGVAFLGQDLLLKKKMLLGSLSKLPSLADLARVNRHLLLYGWLLLTLGCASSFFVGTERDWLRIGWFLVIWAGYATVLGASWTHRLSGRKTAWWSLLCFALMLGTFWGVEHATLSLRP